MPCGWNNAGAVHVDETLHLFATGLMSNGTLRLMPRAGEDLVLQGSCAVRSGLTLTVPPGSERVGLRVARPPPLVPVCTLLYGEKGH